MDFKTDILVREQDDVRLKKRHQTHQTTFLDSNFKDISESK